MIRALHHVRLLNANKRSDRMNEIRNENVVDRRGVFRRRWTMWRTRANVRLSQLLNDTFWVVFPPKSIIEIFNIVLTLFCNLYHFEADSLCLVALRPSCRLRWKVHTYQASFRRLGNLWVNSCLTFYNMLLLVKLNPEFSSELIQLKHCL